MFDVSLLFKIGAMGILLMVIEKILKGNGKEEIAVLANLAGIIIILITVIGMISNLYIYRLFHRRKLQKKKSKFKRNTKSIVVIK